MHDRQHFVYQPLRLFQPFCVVRGDGPKNELGNPGINVLAGPGDNRPGITDREVLRGIQALADPGKTSGRPLHHRILNRPEPKGKARTIVVRIQGPPGCG